MRVDNIVTHVPPLRTREADHETTSRSPADNGRNCTRGELPQNLLTPNFGTKGSLICGPNLVKNPVQRGNISSEDSAEILAVRSLLPFGKGTVCADFAGSHGDVARAEGTNGWISIRIWVLN
jgi:hypothetical protein